MGLKDGNKLSVNKPAMACAVAALQRESRKIDAERAEMATLKRQLVEDPECLSGDRAELYHETLEMVDSFVTKIADAAILMRAKASVYNEKFNLEIDFKQIDTEAQDSLSQAKSTRSKKLKG